MTIHVIGAPLPRVDGRAKVTGEARYAADFNQEGQLYAVLVSATISLGRVTAIDTLSVTRMPGVVAVISHLNAPRLVYNPHKGFIDPSVGERLHVLRDDQVRFYGEPVAIIVAESIDQAERAAAALQVSYTVEKAVFDPTDLMAQPITPEPRGRAHADKSRGEAVEALRQAPVKIDASYDMAREKSHGAARDDRRLER